MTSNELYLSWCKQFGMEKDWPKIYYVDSITYANCCQSVFLWGWDNRDIQERDNGQKSIEVWLGPNKGLMFKNVELMQETSL